MRTIHALLTGALAIAAFASTAAAAPAAPASASAPAKPPPASAHDDALRTARDRVARDRLVLAAADKQVDTTNLVWKRAVAADRIDDAGRDAQRHFQALVERDHARAELARSEQQYDKLDHRQRPRADRKPTPGR
jgi:hypothetical protein